MQVKEFFKVHRKERNLYRGLIYRNLMKTYLTDKFSSTFHKIYNLKQIMEPNIYYEDQQHISNQYKAKFSINSKFIFKKPYFKDDSYYKPQLDVSLQVKDISNRYLALMLINMRENIKSKYLYNTILQTIYNKKGFIQYRQNNSDTQYAIWNYYKDIKMDNFLKYSQPYEYDSESD